MSSECLLVLSLHWLEHLPRLGSGFQKGAHRAEEREYDMSPSLDLWGYFFLPVERQRQDFTVLSSRAILSWYRRTKKGEIMAQVQFLPASFCPPWSIGLSSRIRPWFPRDPLCLHLLSTEEDAQGRRWPIEVLHSCFFLKIIEDYFSWPSLYHLCSQVSPHIFFGLFY